MSTEHEQFGAENPSSTTSPTTKVIGLTGGIASGKSTISKLFSDLGVVILDADRISREVVEPGQPALTEIADHFGPEFILDDGNLDRAKLSALMFNNEVALKEVNNIIHPRVAQRFFEKIEYHTKQSENWIIYDAALIVENNLQSGFAGLVVVKCDPAIQKKRLIKRNAYSEIEAQSRIDSQFPLEKKVAVADWIIDNSGTLEESKQQVHDLFETLCRQFGTPNARKSDE